MEKRKERRFKQWNKTNIKSSSGARGAPDPAGINAYTHDISLGGAMIYSEENFPVGTEIRMHIELARSGESIKVDGVVKWIKQNEREKVYELGVELSHLTSRTVFSLMQNLYDQSPGLPTKISERK
jgi:Tfp pilus assembly protein PilZ